jgi:hypothetical protein
MIACSQISTHYGTKAHNPRGGNHCGITNVISVETSRQVPGPVSNTCRVIKNSNQVTELTGPEAQAILVEGAG